MLFLDLVIMGWLCVGWIGGGIMVEGGWGSVGKQSWVGDWFLDKGSDEWCIRFWCMSTMAY